jgi:hypothetical protein
LKSKRNSKSSISEHRLPGRNLRITVSRITATVARYKCLQAQISPLPCPLGGPSAGAQARGSVMRASQRVACPGVRCRGGGCIPFQGSLPHSGHITLSGTRAASQAELPPTLRRGCCARCVATVRACSERSRRIG